MIPPNDLDWRKSSFSAAQGECVEVALLPLGVAIRDSKDTAGPRLAFPDGAWRALIEAR